MTGTAGGNITPLSLLVLSTAADNTLILASGTGTPIVGVSGQGTRRPSGDFFNDDGFIAVSGETFRVFQTPEKEAAVRLGGTVTRGDLITSDGSGFGITATSGQETAGQALQSGVAGQVITIKLENRKL